MDIQVGQLGRGFLFILGLILIIGGIATSAKGACVLGMIIAVVNFQQWQKPNQQ